MKCKSLTSLKLYRDQWITMPTKLSFYYNIVHDWISSAQQKQIVGISSKEKYFAKKNPFVKLLFSA